MAKDKKKSPPKDDKNKRAEYKKAHTLANKAKAKVKHDKRMERQKKRCPKVKRGTARALRRWCDKVSREFPTVLKGKYNPAHLHRVSPKREAKPPVPMFKVNGVEVFSPAHAGFMVRELAQQAKQRQAERATALAA